MSSLIKLIDEVSKREEKNGSLQTIKTDCELLQDKEIEFVIRKLQGSNLKIEAANKRSKDFNPFLPYEKDLFIKELSETHLIVLNKFNVVKNHLLIITKKFVDQESVISPIDFEAVTKTMKDIDNGLMFYNSGRVAGASQKHRHLQVVPLPLAPIGSNIPVEKVILSKGDETIKEITALPYKNLAVRIEGEWTVEHANALYNHYIYMLDQLNLFKDGEQLLPYNLLLTSRWLMVIPRTMESVQGISINGLGMAGTFLVKNSEELKIIKEVGPNQILRSCSTTT